MKFQSFGHDELARLNSATKYPSIPTYHALGDRGRLTADLNVDLPAEVFVTEKIDGTNTRIIVSSHEDDELIIGSREELLHHTSDLIFNPAQGIVAAVYSALQDGMEPNLLASSSAITVIYGEVYGGKVTAGSKQYTGVGATGFRVFDIARIPLDVLDLPVERIAAWRDGGGQLFMPAGVLSTSADKAGFVLVPGVCAPRPPSGLADTLAWLEDHAAVSSASLDEGAGGRAEGVVIRSADRSLIAKLRFEDYRRTLKVGKS